MAGGGMGGVSSTGYGQQSAQPNFGSNIDPNHIFTDDFGRNNAAATPSNGQVAPTPTTDLNGMRNLLGGMSRTTGQSPFGNAPIQSQQLNPGATAPAPGSREAYRKAMATTSFTPGGEPTYEQWLQQQSGRGRQQNPFTADAKPNPFLSTPANQNSQPTSPIFNAQYYLQQNPDVAANTYFNANPYQHYLQYGMSEGRSPFAPQTAQPVTAPAPVQETPYIPVTTTFSTQQQGPTFNAPIVTQANEGAAVNYQYNRGGIASLVRR